MPKKLRLDAEKAAIRTRMEAGEIMDSYTVWRSSTTGTYKWAYATLSKWHQAGLIHIAHRERRPNGGTPRPFFRWGKGKDAPPLDPLPDAVKHRRYVLKLRADPERFEAFKDRRALHARKTPKLDPIHAAMLGYVRQGNAWIKKNETTHTDAATA
jgi:hypothetical protein